MRTLIALSGLVLGLASTLRAQGRGGRQGGAGPAAMGPQCLNPMDVKQVKSTSSMTDEGGVSVPVTTVVITGNPGVGRLLNPCPAGIGGDDPFAKFFFPPDLVMSHQQAINLSENQRASLGALMLDAQKTFVPAQLKMASEVEQLQRLIAAGSVDEAAVLEQVDRILAIEREVKRTQLALMIRTKNLLTQQQRDALARLRSGE